MKVLFVAAESLPFIKTGGLGDVIGSLPKALKERGVDARVVLPLYGEIKHKYREQLHYLTHISVKLSYKEAYCGIFELENEGVLYYFIDNESYFKRENPYGYFDDGERFGFFAKAAIDILPELNFKPDIIHCHDWHTGMLPVVLKSHYWDVSFYKDIKTVFTIHNLHYQGIFPHETLWNIFGLDDSHFNIGGLEYHGNINYMKGGIVYSDKVNTVSKTYSEEIKGPYLGEGLDGILRFYSHKLTGILNGIDYDIYNPKHDKNIPFNYDYKTLKKKSKNKEELQKELGLEIDKDKPLICLISRLVEQKGIDLVLHVMEELLNTMDIQVAVLGSGDENYEAALRRIEGKYKGRMVAYIGFRPDLSHRIYAGSDMILMPSRYEPCGLSQIIALKYGTIPVVMETGGLKDTIIPYDAKSNQGTGFTFKNYNAHEMLFEIQRAVSLYHKDKKTWNSIVHNAMNSDYSWNKSAEEYISLYQELIE